MHYAVKRDGLIFMIARDLSSFPRNIQSMVMSEADLLNSDQDRLTQIYNKNADIPVNGFAGLEDARNRVQNLLSTHFSLETIVMAKRKKNEEVENGEEIKTESKPRAPRIPKTAIIRVLVSENPKRSGSAAHDRFALYVDGQTVGDFLEAGGTMGDVNFDQSKEFIRLENLEEETAA